MLGTSRTGGVRRIEKVTRAEGRRGYVVSYDEEPQDHFLTTPAKDGAELPQELAEPE